MSITAEVVSRKADRFRAYTTAKMLRSPRYEDNVKRHDQNLPPYPKGAQIRYDVQQVAMEGSVSGDKVTIVADPATVITKVVFYAGPVEEETVVGSVDVNASGTIEIDFVEPAPQAAAPAAAAPAVFDE